MRISIALTWRTLSADASSDGMFLIELGLHIVVPPGALADELSKPMLGHAPAIAYRFHVVLGAGNWYGFEILLGGLPGVGCLQRGEAILSDRKYVVEPGEKS